MTENKTKTTWIKPFKNKKWQLTNDSMSFLNIDNETVEIPINNHVGSFGYKRKFDVHTGIDFYVEEGTEVLSMTDGKVIGIYQFTGSKVGSPWWLDTDCVLIENDEEIILYGEITPNNLKVGQEIKQGEVIGKVTKVLPKNKGRPQSMLHLELHSKNSTLFYTWLNHEEKPNMLLDPTDKCKLWVD